MAEPENPLRNKGFNHYHTDEELLRYSKISPEDKLRWLQQAWEFTSRYLPPEKLEAYQKMRRGEI